MFTLRSMTTCSALNYLDGVLKMVKMLSLQLCTLLAINDRYLDYITEEAGSPTYAPCNILNGKLLLSTQIQQEI